MKNALALAVLVWLLLAAPTSRLLAADRPDVPPALVPWQAWVLAGSDEAVCPPDGTALETRLCVFPTSLSLETDATGAKFSMRVRLFREGAVVLPRGDGVWAGRMTVNGAPAAVAERDGWPVVWLPAGSHVLAGRLDWEGRPQTLLLPPEIGLVSLTRDGMAVAPVIGPGGELRLTAEAAVKAVENRESVRVFRLVADGVPVTVTTLFRLEVSGLARTVRLAGAVPAGTVPLAVRAPAAASLGPDGSLALDTGPGRYDVEVVARYPARVEKLGPAACPYGREVWSYQAAPQGRETRAEGVPAIDPATADVPATWRGFPAFLVEPGASLTLLELGRGAPVGRDALTLTREFWLDFSGQGLTVRDSLTGENRSDWRMAMLAPGELGRVSLGGRDQPLLLLGPDQRAGVELRQARLRLTSESRYPDKSARLPATAFDRECDRITATLHLPPGWQLVTAAGPDSVRGGMLSGWTLLDLFLVFVLAVAAMGLAGKPAGLMLGAFLLVSWHEPGAPDLEWVYVLAGLALLRVTGAGGRLAGRPGPRRVAVLFFSLAALVVAVESVPFVMTQLRQAVAPQVGRPAVVQPVPRAMAPSPPPVPAMRQAEPAEEASVLDLATSGSANRGKRKAPGTAKALGGAVPEASRLDFDPDALVQTGPGLPTWQWDSVSLDWKGPVAVGQDLRLYLLPPWAVAGLHVARVVLLALALWLGLGARGLRRSGPLALVLAAGLWLLPLAGPGQAWAGDFPPQPLLDALRSRLTEPPRCAPHCLGGSGMAVSLENGRLRLDVGLDTAIRAALPLPVVSEGWRPAEVQLDGKPAGELVRQDEGLRVLAEPGHHMLRLEGPAPAAVSFTIAPGLAPGHVTVTAPGYRVRGLDGRGGLRGVLECTKTGDTAGQTGPVTGATTRVPPFFGVERTVTFGLTWEVATTVTRRSLSGEAVVASVPLLPGELPDSSEVTVRDGRAQVPFAAGQGQVSWHSRLPAAPQLVLTAPTDDALVETWTVRAAPFYDLTFVGLAPAVRVGPDGTWQPRFLPWPGEKLSIGITRPEAAPGAVLTLERANLDVRQGAQTRDVTLTMRLRAAKGGRHVVGLPAGAVVTHLAVAGRETLPTGGPGELGFSVAPGVTEVVARFREPVPLALATTTPAVDLRLPAVNVVARLELPRERWLLFTWGQTPLGPVVLFWGWLVAVLAVSLALSCLPFTPLTRRQWLLYGLGLSQAAPGPFVLAVGWLLGLGWRSRWGIRDGKFLFNLVQLLLVLLTLVGLASLYDILQSGLLGLPRVQVGGNGSTATALVWTYDRVAGPVPVATAVTAPLLVFRGLMLAWALWLAWALLSWLRFGFDSLTRGGGWRPFTLRWSRPRPDEDGPQPPRG
ncbi:MAG: hypothetical protein AB7U59_09205 [Desulfovibrionaceae bacterium]